MNNEDKVYAAYIHKGTVVLLAQKDKHTGGRLSPNNSLHPFFEAEAIDGGSGSNVSYFKGMLSSNQLHLGFGNAVIDDTESIGAQISVRYRVLDSVAHHYHIIVIPAWIVASSLLISSAMLVRSVVLKRRRNRSAGFQCQQKSTVPTQARSGE